MVNVKPKIALVWLKRDLRLRDHAPLCNAINTGLPVIMVYCWEPDVIADRHTSQRHLQFIAQSLKDIDQQLGANAVLQMEGNVIDVFHLIMTEFTVLHVFSHEEIGVKVTFERDKQVRQWLNERQIPWTETPYGAVQRGLPNRQGWNRHWKSVTQQATFDPDINGLKVNHWANTKLNSLVGAPALENNSNFQVGGERRAWHTLYDFFKGRGQDYYRKISFPLDARTACTRLSPYLAWGNITIRQVIQFIEQQKANGNAKGTHWTRTLTALRSRLQWQSHFIQKFESEHQMEFRAVNRAYAHFPFIDGPESHRRFVHWRDGKTGYPLVDACMRALAATGYLNFRMRAMVTSFLCHHLNVDWRCAAEYLAQQFLDFEPGIHFPQIQMQASVTGVHTVRLYNPATQSKRLDPEALFIKKWLPELENLPKDVCHAPYNIPPLEAQMLDFDIARDYFAPIVDIQKDRKLNAERLWSFKQRDDVLKEAKRIVKMHTLADSPSRVWVKENTE